MSVFCEPNVIVCGSKSFTHHAICSRRVDEFGNHIISGPYTEEQLIYAPVLKKYMTDDHIYCPVHVVDKILQSTFTPCKFYHPLNA